MPKRILVVTQHFWPENFRINDIVDGFLADDIAVDVLCGMPNYPKGEWFDGYDGKNHKTETYHGARVFRCREIRRKGNTSVRIFLNYVSWPIAAACSLWRLPSPKTAEGQYDAIFCYNTSPVLMSFPAILAARKYKAPLTNYVLDIWPENLYSVLPIQNKLLRGIASAVSDWHYRRAERLIAMSPGLETRLHARVGGKNARGCVAREKQYAVIPQYCEDFYAVPACNTALKAENDGKFTIMFAGNFSPAQSLDTALDALALLQEEARNDICTDSNADNNATDHHTNANSNINTSANNHAPTSHLPIQLLLVGDGMSCAALKEQAQRLCLGDAVRFYGSVAPSEIPALSGAVDALLVCLSDSPDLGLTIPAKLASCMAAAKPLLVSMSGEGALAASESGGALVSPATNAKALAENMRALAQLPKKERERLGQASFAYYQAHYQRDALLKQIETFIL